MSSASLPDNINYTEDKKTSKSIQYFNCVYTSCYCEENVWKVCQQIKTTNGDEELKDYYVVFISNRERKVPLWMQKQGKDPLTPVVWDYHVILIQKPKTKPAAVFDLDSVMPFPCPFGMYLEQVIRLEHNLKKDCHRKFRMIAANEYLDDFASDRSHMLKPNGEYFKPPPNYPPIRTAEEAMNLDDYIDMSVQSGKGRVKDLKGFAKFFGITLPIL